MRANDRGMTKTTDIKWTKPELLADADTWAAYGTVMAILADRVRVPTSELIIAEAEEARAWALTQPSHVADRWGAAYARLASALR